MSEEKLPFVWPEQRAVWRELFKRSQSTHHKLVWSCCFAIDQKKKKKEGGASYFLRLGGGNDVTALCLSREPVPSQLVDFGGNFFLNLGEGVWCLCFSSSTAMLGASI